MKKAPWCVPGAVPTGSGGGRRIGRSEGGAGRFENDPWKSSCEIERVKSSKYNPVNYSSKFKAIT